ncbi:MAG TPA: neutral zinc metallopeptidase [Vicinamibacteria bacterium]
MRLEGEEQSQNVEDRRGRGGMRSAGGLGCVGILVVLGISLLTGQDPTQLLQILEQTQAVQEQAAPPDAGAPVADDRLGVWARQVLGTTERVWTEAFREMGAQYQPPTLVLFEGRTPSACGMGSAAMGPFYCSADEKLYLDFSFFDELHRRFGAPGDFAQAYVIAHEVGHHVQHLLGIQDKVTRAQQGARSEEEANSLSVRLELQADCLAGVWGNRANRLHPEKPLLEEGDIEEGLRAAAAIGDDRMQKMAQGYVQPESWTHGSSQQRVEWLTRGLKSGDPQGCQTF